LINRDGSPILEVLPPRLPGDGHASLRNETICRRGFPVLDLEVPEKTGPTFVSKWIAGRRR
jgi:hypothetical protein